MPNALADCFAIAAMPGLEQLAEAIDDADPRQRRSGTHTVSLLILAGASRACRSQEAAASTFIDDRVWELVRYEAARVGRQLPLDPPTPDQIDHLLRRGGADIGRAAEEALNRVAVDLAHSAGLLLPGRRIELDPPSRAHFLTADGTVASALSEVTEANKDLRSRAADLDNARTCEMFWGKPRGTGEDKRILGLPFVVVSTHGGPPQQRIVFGFQTYQDGNEIGASMEALNRIIPLAGDGVHTVHYDKLMQDKNVHELTARHGVVPIVEMHKAAARAKGLDVDPADSRFARGRHGQHAPKPRVRTQHYGGFSHDVAGGSCWHRLWMLDGQLRATSIGEKTLSLDADVVERISVRRQPNGDRYQMLTTYRVPCHRHGAFEITVDMAQDPTGRENDLQALNLLHAGPVRILNERDPGFWRAAGRRSDSESTIRTIKHTMPLAGRATRLLLENFLFDLVGAALLINARTWDVHVAQHTRVGEQEYRRQARLRSEGQAA